MKKDEEESSTEPKESSPPTEKKEDKDEKKEASAETSGKKEKTDPDANLPRISQPSVVDVLFGRGKPYQGHAGNIRLHKIVDLYKARYSNARRHEKTEIAEEIVQFIKSPSGANKQPGRFLKKLDNEEAWVQVNDSVARDKVSHALRGKPRKETDGDGRAHGSGGVMQELMSVKRNGGMALPMGVMPGGGVPPNKRPKFQHLSDMELFAANNGTSNSNFLAAASMMQQQQFQQQQQQQQLFAALAAERQFTAGFQPQYGGGMGFFGQGHPSMMAYPGMSGGTGEMNPLLLQQMAAERQMRGGPTGGGDPRLW
eukprot:CAMPEP_0176184446 /NCGR_PEP_ID=MMETSP0121_2-20121125/821_1 /TAXON_ID=160619 /ORGANISM="Kryptoperidinium foliaceum, Strain CCMP 1326" /LENGTH=311 /DNA_ID=CAMNT_0017522825 /DNA_START=37 /DNA_END=969 /DNA_ORIENTATION=+